MSLPSVSVVIAAWPDLRGLAPALEALGSAAAEAGDVTVVSPRPRPAEIAAAYPWAGWIDAPESALIPQLWALGIARARGDVVATTTAHFRPADDWIARIRKSHVERRAAAIGGPIDPPEAGSAVAWAIYLLRYSAYLSGAPEPRLASDLAADNASYKRGAFEAHPEALRDGFWERELHEALRAEGQELVFDPRIRVRQHACFDFLTFLRQRFQHGVQFGRARLRGQPRLLAPLAALAAGLVPLLLLWRTAARAVAARRHLRELARALPALASFAVAWSAGEAAGYLAHAAAPMSPLAARA